jgi:TolA-binding protein
MKYPNHARTAELSGKYPETVAIDTLMQNVAREIFRDSTSLNEMAARQYVDACEVYALVNPGTDASAEYLHKASETARTLRSTAKALAIYDWILKSYPEHKRSSQALFLKGFTYDNELRDYDKARIVYEEFLQKYPDDEFASSAQFLLENLGKSDDELLEALQKKAATQQTPAADSVQ